MLAIALRVDDALYGIVRSDPCRFENVLIVHECARECGGVDISGAVPTFEQYVIARLLQNGDFERHIKKVRRNKKKELAGIGK